MGLVAEWQLVGLVRQSAITEHNIFLLREERLVLSKHKTPTLSTVVRFVPHSKTEDGPLVEPLDEVGHARWRGARGMTSLPKYLAAQLAEPVRTGVRVGSIGVQDNTVRLVCENNDVVVARAAVLTVPVPQAHKYSILVDCGHQLLTQQCGMYLHQ